MIDMSDPKVSQIGHPAPPWMVNYADLMTELVCFFVILYALSAALSKGMQDAKEKIEEMMKEQKDQAQVQVEMKKDGMQVTLEEKEGAAYFEVGKADITDQGKKMLDLMAPILEPMPNDIVIEGHTDGVPIHNSQFDTNWELSTARATNVVKYMVRTRGLSPKKLAAVGYGEYKPIGPNDTPEQRAKNRRVVFFIKTK
jgi:chemotaxis protein MotB